MSIPPGDCVCIKCKTRKDNTEFQYNTNYLKKDGYWFRRAATCKECISKQSKVLWRLKKNYARPPIGTECACCGRNVMDKKDDVNNPQTETYKMVLDHDHVTGKFRGWICSHCNQAIGHANESIETLMKMVEYLQTPAAEPLMEFTKTLKNNTQTLDSKGLKTQHKIVQN